MEQSTEALAAIPGRLVEAWKRGDAAGFAADFAPDGRLVDFEGSIFTGPPAIIAWQQPAFETVLKGSRLVNSQIPFAQIVQPGVGVVHHRVWMLLAGESEPLPTRQVMQLLVTHWREDRWQIVALQNSRVVSLEAAGRLDSVA